jgi:hypothetical protein
MQLNYNSMATQHAVPYARRAPDEGDSWTAGAAARPVAFSIGFNRTLVGDVTACLFEGSCEQATSIHSGPDNANV